MATLQKQITTYIILGLTILVVAPMLNNLHAETKSATNDAVCEESMVINSAVKDATKAIQSTGVECPADYVEIKENKQNEYYYEMYRLLDRCWKKTLGMDNKLSNGILWTDKPVSLVCYSFTVNTDKLNGVDFAEYLGRNDPKKGMARYEVLDTDLKRTDNYQYFSDLEPGKWPLGKGNFIENKKYLVMFVSRKFQSDIGWNPSEGYYVTSSDGYSKHVFIIPEEDWFYLHDDDSVDLWQK